MPGERLNHARKVRNVTVAKLSELTGFAVSTIGAHQNGQNNIKQEAADTYEKALNLPEGFILYGLDENGQATDDIQDETPISDGIPIRYRVQAGIWEEVFENHSYSLADYGMAPFLPLEGVSINDQWAEQIIGDSVNKKYPDGTIIHVRRFYKDIEELPIGSFVVIQHYKHGLAKRTVKKLVLIDNKPVAIGFSFDDKWNVPVYFGQEPEDGETAEIDAIVVRGLLL